jgi:glutamate racemase
VLDSSQVVAEALWQYLHGAGLLHDGVRGPDQFLVSDFTDSFEASTRLFFSEAVHLERYPLWN